MAGDQSRCEWTADLSGEQRWFFYSFGMCVSPGLFWWLVWRAPPSPQVSSCLSRWGRSLHAVNTFMIEMSNRQIYQHRQARLGRQVGNCGGQLLTGGQRLTLAAGKHSSYSGRHSSDRVLPLNTRSINEQRINYLLLQPAMSEREQNINYLN